MSYRIWINVFNMTFMSWRTESDKDAALGIAKALARALPEANVGVDEVTSVHTIVQPIRSPGLSGSAGER